MYDATHAVLFHDNSTGDHDEYHVLAYKKGEMFFCCETGRQLIEYEGSKIVKVWPLIDETQSASELRISNIVAGALDFIGAVKSGNYGIM